MRQIRVVISCVRNFVVNVGHDGQAGAGLELRQVCCNLLRKFIMLSNKISGKIKLSAIIAGAFAAALVPGAAFAGASTAVTWNFGTASSSASGSATGNLGNSATFTGTENPVNSLGSPLNGDLGITAYGYEVSTSQKLDYYGNPTGSPTYNDSTAAATGLYGKDSGSTETGLGLSGFTDNEISDTSPTVGGNWWSGYHETYKTGMIQISLANILAFLTDANPSDATLTIGSLQSPDEAIISVSNALGTIGTEIGHVNSANGANQSTALSLSELTGYSYLNITAAAAGQAGGYCQPGTPGQSVLLSTMTLNVLTPTTTPAGPSAPVPASEGLLAVGGLGLIPLMLVRRRKTAI